MSAWQDASVELGRLYAEAEALGASQAVLGSEDRCRIFIPTKREMMGKLRSIGTSIQPYLTFQVC